MRKGWFNDMEKVDVTILAEKEGWFLQKYRLESDVSFRNRGRLASNGTDRLE